LRPEKDVPFNVVSQVLSELASAKPPFPVKMETKDNPIRPIPEGLKAGQKYVAE
jgi:hypothetical protein